MDITILWAVSVLQLRDEVLLDKVPFGLKDGYDCSPYIVSGVGKLKEK